MTNKGAMPPNKGGAAQTAAAPEKKPTLADGKRKKIKVPPESIKLEIFGDLCRFSKKSPAISIPFKKYDHLATTLASFPREERLVLYKYICGLALTAHARRIKDTPRRKELFDVKNRLILALANNPHVRRVLNFRMCVSRRFRVVQHCPDCVTKHTANNTPRSEWTHCQKCSIDKNFFNVLSIYHKFEGGGACLYLGNEHVHAIKGLKEIKRANLGDFDEEIAFGRYHFSPHNLNSLDLNSVLTASTKLLDLNEKMMAQLPPFHGGHHSSTGSSGNTGYTPRPHTPPRPPAQDAMAQHASRYMQQGGHRPPSGSPAGPSAPPNRWRTSAPQKSWPKQTPPSAPVPAPAEAPEPTEADGGSKNQ